MSRLGTGRRHLGNRQLGLGGWGKTEIVRLAHVIDAVLVCGGGGRVVVSQCLTMPDMLNFRSDRSCSELAFLYQ